MDILHDFRPEPLLVDYDVYAFVAEITSSSRRMYFSDKLACDLRCITADQKEAICSQAEAHPCICMLSFKNLDIPTYYMRYMLARCTKEGWFWVVYNAKFYVPDHADNSYGTLEFSTDEGMVYGNGIEYVDRNGNTHIAKIAYSKGHHIFWTPEEITFLKNSPTVSVKDT